MSKPKPIECTCVPCPIHDPIAPRGYGYEVAKEERDDFGLLVQLQMRANEENALRRVWNGYNRCLDYLIHGRA